VIAKKIDVLQNYGISRNWTGSAAKKRVFEKPKQASEQKNGVLKNIGKARTVRSLVE